MFILLLQKKTEAIVNVSVQLECDFSTYDQIILVRHNRNLVADYGHLMMDLLENLQMPATKSSLQKSGPLK